jgi:probable HAF family extracellular repeat protein
MNRHDVACTYSLAIVATVAAMSLPAAATAGTQYSVVNLGSFGGVWGQASSIDDAGTIAGASDPKGDGLTHAAVWGRGHGPVDLGTLGGGNSAVAWPNHDNFPLIAGISETAEVEPLGEDWSCAIFFYPVATGHVCVGFVEFGGRMWPLPTLGGYDGYAAGTNDFGQVVGWAETTYRDATCEGAGVGFGQVLQFLPAVWNPPYRKAEALPTLPGDSDGDAVAVNDFGVAVGNSGECDQAVGRFTAQHVVMWDHGRVTNIPYAPTLGGAAWNTPTDISNSGEIVGFANLRGNTTGNYAPHAFAWTARTGMDDLGTISVADGVSSAGGVNDFGEVVGYSGSRAFVYQNGTMTDLNTLVDASGASLYLVVANDVNDRGEIAGQACVLASGQCTDTLVPFLAIPHRANGTRRAPARSSGRSIVIPASLRARILRRYLGASAM